MFAGPMFLKDRPAKVDSGSVGAGDGGRLPCAMAVDAIRTAADRLIAAKVNDILNSCLSSGDIAALE
jgi:hypothetical protein